MWTLRNQSDIAKALLHSNQASFLKIYFLIAGKLLYNIVLVSGTQHRESVIIIYICLEPPSADPHPSHHWVITVGTRLGSLCCI